MKKSLTLALALALVALVSASWAAISLTSARSIQKPPETAASNLNLSKSNINRLVYEKGVVSSTQATEILKDLDKLGKDGKVEESKVREILQSHGIRADSMKEILYLPKTKTRALPTYVLLRDPKNKPAAIALNDPVPLRGDRVVWSTMPSGTYANTSQLQNPCSQANTQLLDRLSAVEACDKLEKQGRIKEARNCRDALKNVPATFQAAKALTPESACPDSDPSNTTARTVAPGNATARTVAPGNGAANRIACWGGVVGGCAWAICCSGHTCCGHDCSGPKGCRSE